MSSLLKQKGFKNTFKKAFKILGTSNTQNTVSLSRSSFGSSLVLAQDSKGVVLDKIDQDLRIIPFKKILKTSERLGAWHHQSHHPF